MDRAAKSAPEHERLAGSVAPESIDEGDLVLGKARFVHQKALVLSSYIKYQLVRQ
jgi:hypothetical protein